MRWVEEIGLGGSVRQFQNDGEPGNRRCQRVLDASQWARGISVERIRFLKPHANAANSHVTVADLFPRHPFHVSVPKPHVSSGGLA